MAQTAVKSPQNFVNGEFVEALSGETQEVINPATGEVIAEVPKGSADDVDRAVKAARRAFDEEWFDSTPGERFDAIMKLAQVIEDNAEEFIEIESMNVGKPKTMVRDEEMPACLDNLRFFAAGARFLEGKAAGEYMRGHTSIIRREPVGVVGSIAPWNYPLMMAVWKIGPALAAGNTVVLKPSEQTPLSVLRLAELAADVFPKGVFNVITGDGEPVGAGLVRHPQVDMVSLTGDVATGKEVAKAASETLKNVHLELGGKAPVIVFDDADVENVVEWIKVGGYFNSGQDCTAATRVIAGPNVYDNLLSDLVPAVESLKWGDPSQDDTEMGSLVSPDQLERVTGFVQRAQEGGATILTGGPADNGQGSFYKPTVVTDIDQDSEIIQREVFGPVVTVQRLPSDDDAIAWANGVDYGLASSVFTTNHQRAMNAARKLKFGTVWINTHILLVSEMPHGGYKQSGYGKDLSSYSIEDYTQIKHVMTAIE